MRFTQTNSPSDFFELMEALVVSKGRIPQAITLAKQKHFTPRVLASLQKAVMAAGTTTDATWAGPLVGYTDLVNDWFQTLRNISLLDALIDQGAKRVPADVRFVLTTLGAVGHVIDQAAWFPISKMGFEGDRQGFLLALSAVVLSNEIVRFSSSAAQSLINSELAGAVSATTNASVVAALLTGVTLTASSTDARTDLQTIFASVNLTARSKPILVAAPQLVTQLALLGTPDGASAFPDVSISGFGGSIAGVPLLAIDELHAHGASGVDGDVLMLVDASQIAADAGVLEVEVSDDANLQMSDSPTQAPSNTVSMFQTNSLCIRARRFFSLQHVRAAAVAGIKNASYQIQIGSP